MNVLETLQYMKPDIKVVVWENDIDQIQYNESEDFRPSKEDILAVDQSLVEAYHQQKATEQKQLSLEEIQSKISELQQQLQSLING